MKKRYLIVFSIFQVCLNAQPTAHSGKNLPKNALYSHIAIGFSGQGPYTSSMGLLGFRFDHVVTEPLGYSTGLSVLGTGYGGSIGIPLFMQLRLLTKRGRGLILNGGAYAQYGFQPFLIPSAEMKLRFLGGRKRFFMDIFSMAYFARGKKCANGTYTCPSGPFTATDSGGMGLGLSIGAFLK